eukprot:jgi/Bigna1/80688/fgenesh1_pg.73_\
MSIVKHAPGRAWARRCAQNDPQLKVHAIRCTLDAVVKSNVHHITQRAWSRAKASKCKFWRFVAAVSHFAPKTCKIHFVTDDQENCIIREVIGACQHAQPLPLLHMDEFGDPAESTCAFVKGLVEKNERAQDWSVELKKKVRTEARKRSKEKKNREKMAEKARMRRKRQKLTRMFTKFFSTFCNLHVLALVAKFTRSSSNDTLRLAQDSKVFPKAHFEDCPSPRSTKFENLTALKSDLEAREKLGLPTISLLGFFRFSFRIPVLRLFLERAVSAFVACFPTSVAPASLPKNSTAKAAADLTSPKSFLSTEWRSKHAKILFLAESKVRMVGSVEAHDLSAGLRWLLSFLRGTVVDVTKSQHAVLRLFEF